MKIIRPIDVTPPLLVSSSAPEDANPEWAPGVTYADKAMVILASTHRRYESIGPGNVGNNPATSPTKWLDAGPTNRWRMFDRSVGTLTTDRGSITVALAPGSADSVAVVDTDAEIVTVSMAVDGTVIYTGIRSTNVGGAAIADWYSYFFEPIGKVSTLTFLDLPSYPSGVLTVTLTGNDPDGPVSVGTLIVGRQLELGSTAKGAKVGIADFSRKVTDDFGATSVIERPFAKRMQLQILTQTSLVDGLQRTLASLRARPILWIAADGFDALAVYGFYKEFEIDIAYATVSYCSLSIEGLI